MVRSLYDGDDLLLEVDGSGARLREFLHYPGVDRPHSLRQWAGASGATYFYATEHPGSVTGLVDRSGNVVNEYRYDPWGKPQTLTEGTSNPLRFHAREADPQTGLYYVRARWYDPELGRFLSEDPLGLEGGLNPYVYVGNSPVNGRDPYGLQPEYPGIVHLPGLVAVAPPATDRCARGACWVRGGGGPSSFGPGSAGGWAGSGSGGTWYGGDSEDSSLSQFFSLGFKVCGSPGVDPDDCVVAATVPSWIGGPGVAGKITGYTIDRFGLRHALHRAISRDSHGVAARAILDAVRNPVRTVLQANGAVKYVGAHATVVLDHAGKMITTWARNSAGWRW